MTLRNSLLAIVMLALCAAPSSAGPQPPAGWTDGYVAANGIRIHYWRTGGNKPPLVMAHGLSDDGLCWTNLAREFQDQYHIIMFDARGHGLSDPPSPSDPPDVQVEDFAGLIKELKLGRPIPDGTFDGQLVGGAFRREISGRGAGCHPGGSRTGSPGYAGGGSGHADAGAAPHGDPRAQQHDRGGPGSRLHEELPEMGTRRVRVLGAFQTPAPSRHRRERSLRPAAGRRAVPEDHGADVDSQGRCAGRSRKQNEDVASRLPRGKIVHIQGAGHNVRRENKAQTIEMMKAFLSGT